MHFFIVKGHVAPGKHSQSLAQAIQEVMNEVSREITELQQQRLRLESTPEVPNQDEEQVKENIFLTFFNHLPKMWNMATIPLFQLTCSKLKVHEGCVYYCL